MLSAHFWAVILHVPSKEVKCLSEEFQKTHRIFFENFPDQPQNRVKIAVHHPDYLQSSGKTVSVTPFIENLPDPDDKPCLEVAIGGHADYLITFNIRHFPEKVQKGIIILTPPDFLKKIRRKLN